MNELLDNAPCCFLVFDDNGKIIETNKTLLNLLGYEPGELTDAPIEKIMSVAGRIFYQTHFFPLLKLQNKAEEIYLSLRSKTGADVPVLVNAFRRERDGVTLNDCVFVPMRQRNLYEDEILRAKKEAEAATEAKNEFLSIVSHELRTPLNAILGWTQMLESGSLDAEHTRRAIETIGRNARAQNQLIEDLLDFSRIVSGKLRLEIGRVDLAEVVRAAIEVVKPSAQSKEIELNADLPANVFISGDAARLQQVVLNLLTNAVKFTPLNGRVEIKLARIESNAEISVRDTGSGISAEFLPHVFERYEQADKTKTSRNSGLGLGLAIVRRIVELHGGTIRAESPGEGFGATFTVRLPVMTTHSENLTTSV
jgi:PAS domain S-box-containing protein